MKSKRECEGYKPRVIFKDPLGAFRSGIAEGDPAKLVSCEVDGNGNDWYDNGKYLELAELLPGHTVYGEEPRFSALYDRSQTAADVIARDDNHGITTDTKKPPSIAERYEPSMRRPGWAEDEEASVEEAGMNALMFTDQHDAPSGGTPLPKMDYEKYQDNTARFQTQIPGPVTPPSPIPDEKRKRNATASHEFRSRRQEKEREARAASEKISKLEQQVQSLLEFKSQNYPPENAYDELHSDAESISQSDYNEDDDDGDNVIGKEDEDPMVTDLLVDLLERYTTLYR